MGIDVSSIADLLDSDLAGTYRRTPSNGASIDAAVVEADRSRMTLSVISL